MPKAVPPTQPEALVAKFQALGATVEAPTPKQGASLALPRPTEAGQTAAEADGGGGESGPEASQPHELLPPPHGEAWTAVRQTFPTLAIYFG
jgi:hypothetical protein